MATGTYFVGNVTRRANILDKAGKGIKYYFVYDVDTYNTPSQATQFNWRVTTVDFSGNESSGTTATWQYGLPAAATNYSIRADGVRSTFKWTNPADKGIRYARVTYGVHFTEVFTTDVAPQKKVIYSTVNNRFTPKFYK